MADLQEVPSAAMDIRPFDSFMSILFHFNPELKETSSLIKHEHTLQSADKADMYSPILSTGMWKYWKILPPSVIYVPLAGWVREPKGLIMKHMTDTMSWASCRILTTNVAVLGMIYVTNGAYQHG